MTTTTATQAPAARTERLTKIYGGGLTEVTALDQVSLEIGTRSFTAVMGPSGSGKSTLMHCMAGLDSADSGQVWIGTEEITALPELRAADNITLPLDIAGRPADRQWLSTVTETVGLTGRLRHRPTELSGGQQPRVAIARALAGRPEIIFADEPTGN